ncbi:MAG: alpha/beta hydrolase [Bacteroidia bacterium]|nr:alpha/beta hydrolase [Bacteroidia bacterium]
MPAIQFSHANGFPAKTYSYLFEKIKEGYNHSIKYVPAFGIGKYKIRRNWYPLVDELIEYIEQNHHEPVIGIGHSLGSFITFWAAERRPDLFTKVIMMDPPFLPAHTRLLIRTLGPPGIFGKFFPITRQAYKRKDTFQSKEEAFNYWKPKKLFRNFHPSCFEDYVNHTLQETETGELSLIIPKKLEARLFSLTAWRLGKVQDGVPVHWLYAERSVVPPEQFDKYKAAFPKINFIEMKGGHMFPLEFPQETANKINELINL